MPAYNDPDVQENLAAIRAQGGTQADEDEYLDLIRVDKGPFGSSFFQKLRTPAGAKDIALKAERSLLDDLRGVGEFGLDIAKDTARSASGVNIPKAFKGELPPPEGLSPRRLFPRNTPLQRKIGDVGVAILDTALTDIPLAGATYTGLKGILPRAAKVVGRNLPGAREIKKVADAEKLHGIEEAARRREYLRGQADKEAAFLAKEAARVRKEKQARVFDKIAFDEEQEAKRLARDAASTKRRLEYDTKVRERAAAMEKNLQTAEDAQKLIPEFLGRMTPAKDLWNAIPRLEDVYIDAGNLIEDAAKYGASDDLVNHISANDGKISVNFLKQKQREIGDFIRTPEAKKSGFDRASAMYGRLAKTLEDAVDGGYVYRRKKELGGLTPQVSFQPASVDNVAALQAATKASAREFALERAGRVIRDKTVPVRSEIGEDYLKLNIPGVLKNLGGSRDTNRFKAALGPEEYDELIEKLRALETPKVKAHRGVFADEPPFLPSRYDLSDLPEIEPRGFVSRDIFTPKPFEPPVDTVSDAISRLGARAIVGSIVGAGGVKAAGPYAGGVLAPLAATIGYDAVEELVKRYGKEMVLKSFDPSDPFLARTIAMLGISTLPSVAKGFAGAREKQALP